MFRPLADRLHAIVAAGAGQRGHRMIKLGDTPGAHLMAVFALCAAANMGLDLAGRNLAVMAAETIGRNDAVINLHNAPALGAMTVGALIAGRWMIAALAGCRLAVMAGKTGRRRSLELCARMARLAAHINVLSGERKTGFGMVKIFVDYGLRTSKPASQKQHDKNRSKAAQHSTRRKRIWW